jgi:hypothetical protein
MKNILYGWQLGGGRGHINLLNYIANIYLKLDYQPIFVLKNNRHTQCLKKLGKVEIFPSCFMTNLGVELWSYSDILYAYGYGEEQLLKKQIEIWRSWIKKISPKLVVADFAPSLVIAAKLEKIKTIVVGNVFTVPPAISVEQMPLFRQSSNKKVFERQKKISIVLESLGINQSLGKVLNGDCTLIFSIPELDYYKPWRDPSRIKYAGSPDAPFYNNLAVSKGKVCAYLNKQWREYDQVVQRYQADCTYDELSNIFRGCSLLLHHGGSLITSCLLAGIPQKIFPLQTEQSLRANQLEKLGQVESYEGARNLADKLKNWNQPIAEKELLAALYQFSF